jgi:mannose-1-phosphate guanylyltransferase
VLATVADPSRFGVIVSNSDGKVASFVEKPNYFISNKINAGIYLLNVSVLDRIPQRFCMIEKEIFPQMAKEEKLYSLPLQNDFWFDIGRPADYLIGQAAYLKYYESKSSKEHIGNVLIDPSTVIEEGCKIGPNVVIGPNCTIKAGARLKDCTIIGNAIIGSNSYIEKSIISWKCKIGKWVRIEGLTCLA